MVEKQDFLRDFVYENKNNFAKILEENIEYKEKLEILEKENQEMKNLIDNHFPAMFELLRQRIEKLEKNDSYNSKLKIIYTQIYYE